MARVHSYEWVQDALLDGPEDDDGTPALQMSRCFALSDLQSCGVAAAILPCLLPRVRQAQVGDSP